MYDIITIGSTTFDSFYKVNFKIIDYDTPSGKAYVLPLGEKMGVDDVYATLGGNAANASVTFARQGYKTALISRIGKDAYGEKVLARLKSEKVNTKLVRKSGDKPTASSVLLLQDGERTILSHHGAINDFSIDDIDFKKLKTKWLYVSLPGNSYKLFPKLLEYTSKNNISVAINPSFKHLSEGRDELLKNLKDIKLLVLNEGEAAELTGIPFNKEAEVFKRIDELMPGIVAVTNGPEGVKVSDGKNIYEARTFKEKEIADRTGAGDAFGSAFVAGLIGGGDIKYAIRLASANATSVVEYVGATEGILTRQQFETDPRWQDFPIQVREITNP